MTNFFIGFHHLEASPCYVNKELLRFLTDKKYGYKTHYAGSGLKRRISTMWGILKAKRIIVSGIFLSKSEVRLMRLLRKKFIYLMHGSYTMETGKIHPTENLVRRYASKIVAVSRVHVEMIKNEFPQYADKVVEWFNGINWDDLDSDVAKLDMSRRDMKKIVLFGGGRHMKGNLQVCQAVQQLNDEHGLNLHVDVYGEILDDDFSKEIAAIPCVNYIPLIPKNQINQELAKANIFIANSKFDTFNLSVIEALGLGCNVLFSKNVGAKDIIPAKDDTDIIYNVENIEEIKEKILHLLSNPNNLRLKNSINRCETAWQNRAEQLALIASEN